MNNHHDLSLNANALRAAQGASLAALAQGSIGVFDSGLGGLSVLKHLQAQMPQESFIYVADNAHVPYGDKPEDWIRARMVQMTEWFLAQGCKAIVWACNTATAAGATYLRNRYPQVFFVGLEPALKPALALSETQSVAVLATRRTMESAKYQRLRMQLAAQYPQSQVQSIACVGWAEAIDAGLTQGQEWQALLARHLQAVSARADVWVLGCTHYPFVAADILAYAQQLGRNVQLLDSGAPVARYTQMVLQKRGGLNPTNDAQSVYYATLMNESVLKRWALLLEQPHVQVAHLDLPATQPIV